jgi:hypothetical protein
VRREKSSTHQDGLPVFGPVPLRLEGGNFFWTQLTDFIPEQGAFSFRGFERFHGLEKLRFDDQFLIEQFQRWVHGSSPEWAFEGQDRTAQRPISFCTKCLLSRTQL